MRRWDASKKTENHELLRYIYCPIKSLLYTAYYKTVLVKMVQTMVKCATMLLKLTAATVITLGGSHALMAQDTAVGNDVPHIVTNKPIAQVATKTQGTQPMPGQPAAPVVNNRIESVNKNLYARPPQAADITANTVLNPEYFSPVDTMTAQQINDIQQRLYDLQAQVADKAAELQTLEIVGWIWLQTMLLLLPLALSYKRVQRRVILGLKSFKCGRGCVGYTVWECSGSEQVGH